MEAIISTFPEPPDLDSLGLPALDLVRIRLWLEELVATGCQPVSRFQCE
jgi:hypothetical protein